jgi:uncharacterized membrane protein (UPF0182 family)
MPSVPDEPDYILPSRPAVRRPRSLKTPILLALLFIGFLLVHNATPLYTDWLWFREVGYTSVFTTTIVAKTTLFFLFGALFFVIFYTNVRVARRLAPEDADRFLMQRFGPAWGNALQRGIGRALLAAAIFLSLWAGRLAAEYWANWLEFTHWTPFGIRDPVFGNDVGFYVFRLPLFQFVYEFILGALLLTVVVVVVIHVADRAIETLAGFPNIARGVRAQLLVFGALLAVTQAFGTRLSAYALLNSDHQLFSGAGYADLRYRLFALNAETLLLALTALACIVNLWRRDEAERPDSLSSSAFRWPLIGVGAWIVVILILGNLVPAVGERVYVEPNQFTMEKEYIARNIAFTRQGFGLEKVTRVDGFPADASLTAAGLRANRDTLENVRLWDYEYLAKVYAQLQTIKPYYKFEKDTATGSTMFNIDIDRYPIAGRQRQVMLAAREMDSGGLPASAQTWQNRRLGYTHGYGLAMSPVNRIVDGYPAYFVSDLPLRIAPEASNIHITQPDIYFGQLAHDYVFVDTEQPEFDYPSTGGNGGGGTQDHYTTYKGQGGIRIGDSALAKLAFSLRLGDQNILLAKGFKETTRVLFRRDVRERVQTIAPFLQQDNDPYLVIDPDTGRLIWIIDCYTMSDRYPYSTPQEMTVNAVTFVAPNYVRNSVKATVDAYEGTVRLYVADPNDPIVRTYAKIFPGLLQPLSALPVGLRTHLRYPEDLFRLQRAVYAAYHVDDPRIFYLKEDAWAIPIEPNADQTAGANGNSGIRKMEPYYIIMRLPEQGPGGGQGAITLPPAGAEEFLLMSPLAPINREAQNILGWMCARCDGEHYGELVLYRFPQSASVEGPSQIVQLINSDRVISPQLALLRSGGSTASLGNLLVIPVEKSLLYIAPLYVEATNSANKLPQLQKVVVAFGQRVAMADTLERALSDLFPGDGSPIAPDNTQPNTPAGQPGTVSSVPPTVRSLIERANTQYQSAQQRLKAGDFAGYGAATRELERTLNDLNRAAGNRPPSHKP